MSKSFTGGIFYLQNCDRCNTLYHLQLCFNMHNIATGLKWQLWQHSLCHIIWKLLKNISIINIPTNLKCVLLKLMQFALKEGHLTLFFFFLMLKWAILFSSYLCPKDPKKMPQGIRHLERGLVMPEFHLNRFQCISKVAHLDLGHSVLREWEGKRSGRKRKP